MNRILLGTILLALALRLPALGNGLWYDEIWTLVDFGGLPFGTLLTTYGSDNNHPLYTILAWLSLHLFGSSSWALRLPAALFGAAGAGMLWLLASRIATRAEAIAATLLITFSYHHVWFSQNARGYTALLFFTLAATWLLLEKRWIWYGLALALATYTHLTGVFVAMAHAIILLVVVAKKDPDAKGLLTGLAIATAGSLLLHAAILGEMIEFLFVKREKINVKSEWVSPWWTIKAVAESFGAGLIPGLVAIAGGALVMIAGVIGWWKKDWKLVVAFVAPGIIGAVVMIGLGRNLWPRFFFFLAGFMILIAVRGVATVARGKLFFAAVAVLMIGSLAILPRAYLPKQDFEGARDFVEEIRKPGEVVMTAGLTDLPYQRWLETDYVSIDSALALDRALAGRSGYLLHTLPTFLESRMPELAEAVRARGTEVKRFSGTLGGGDVVVIGFQASR
jgi:4-amino-4-deoxy-L-arabinose transferase-like glycosyltransferase